jgi:hypothetical protein
MLISKFGKRMKYSEVLQKYYLVQKYLKNVTPQKHVIANSGSAPEKIAASSWL